MMMTAPPVAILDVLNSLLEAELNSMFRFMGEGSPYLGRATAEVRRPLAEMVVADRRRAQELADLIESLGVAPTPQVGIRSEEQYLAYLSLKFLLPRLVHEKKLQIERYENAARALAASDGTVKAVLESHLVEMRGELTELEKASEHVIAEAKSAATPPKT
jgi:hypothetical protein